MPTICKVAAAALCAGTPMVQVLDNRGLAVRGLQYNRSVAGEAAEQLMTRQRYTATGKLLSSLDPRLGAAQQLDPTLQPNFRYAASLSGRQLRSLSQDAGTTVQMYDVEGGPVWQSASRQQRTRWTYDALHRLTVMFEQAGAGEPERISERFTYADGTAGAAVANCRGRLVAHHDPAGLNETPRYSLGGQVQLSVRRLLRAEIPASDWRGEAVAWETALEEQAYTSRQGFDALGRVAWSLDAKDNRQQPQFNVAGQLVRSQLTQAGQTSPQVLLRSVRYSAAGQVQQEEAGNGVVSDYHYEAQTQRLNRLTVSRPAQNGRHTRVQDLEYDYDPVGNILAISDAAQPTRYYHNQRIVPSNAYQYDALYQLLSATGRENADAGQQGPGLPIPDVPISPDPNRYSNYTRRYTYDRGGNLTQIRHQGSSHYTQDLVVASTSNRAVPQTGFLTPADVDGYFDAGGNLRQLAPGQPLVWDGRNQLQEVLQVQRDSGSDDREWYRYDGGGQRLLKTSVSQTHATQRQAEVIYLPGLELRRTRSLQGETHTTVEDLQVIRGQAVGRSQVRVLHWDAGQPADIPNDQLRYSLDNQIGSSLLELDQTADILTLEEYFPYGGTAVWSGKSSSETQYKFVRYSGKERDATGLYYYGFRYYMPWLGRWLNPDPAGTVDGLNLFRMVRNNPVMLIDIEGLAPGDQLKEKDKKIAKTKLARSEFDSFFELAVVARDKNLNEEGIINLYHEMSKVKNDDMSLEHAENYIKTLESINETAGGALRIYFQGDREKASPFAHYKISGDRVLADRKGYYRIINTKKRSDPDAKSRINISVKTNKLPLLSKVISDLTLEKPYITQSKIVSPGAINKSAESAVIYFNHANMIDYAEKIAKTIQDEIGLDSFSPVTMIGVKELQTGIGYKEFSEGDTTSVAESLARPIRSAIDSQPSKRNSDKKFRKALKGALQRGGYERKNPALRAR